jgi:hypothetical protein
MVGKIARLAVGSLQSNNNLGLSILADNLVGSTAALDAEPFLKLGVPSQFMLHLHIAPSFSLQRALYSPKLVQDSAANPWPISFASGDTTDVGGIHP